MEEESQLRAFTEKFFSNLNCSITNKGEVLYVDKVPPEFQKYYGKNAPYKIIFDRTKEEPGFEIVTKGSYLLKAMTSYLDKSGETTLLKINFNIDMEKEILSRVNLVNCEIEKLIKKRAYDYFTRFTFLTTLQYLNGREQVTNDIYIYDGKVTSGDLSSYDVVEGNKRDIEIKNIDLDYSTAKEELKNALSPKIKEISAEVQALLEKEIYRIEKHFENKNTEVNETIARCVQRRAIMEKDFSTGDLEIMEKIGKIDKEIDLLQRQVNPEEIEQEKDIEIKSEMQKHSLNISNKVINTTIIYYPLFSFEAFVKNTATSRFIPLSYNPLTGKMNELSCDSCGEEIKEICLDASGHLVCRNCLSQCEDCLGLYCKKCLIKECEICKKKICSRCSKRCSSCGKYVCSKHSKKDLILGTINCTNCLVRCERCGDYFNSNSMHISPSKGSQICSKCLSSEIKIDTLKRLK